jgi:hypothetical protein
VNPSGNGGHALQQMLAAMLADRLGIAPAEAATLASDPAALMQRMMAMREREQPPQEDGELGSRLDELRRRIDECERDFGFALAVVDHAAALLGACRRCLGFDGDCERCRGRGRPGARASADSTALQRWVGHLVRRLQPT